MTHVSQMN